MAHTDEETGSKLATETTSLLTSNASTFSNDESAIHKQDLPADVTIPEISTLGRKIGWFSAYILVISRVIGSGIFAMPGVIVQNVGSPGLALVLWVVGALTAWVGLAVCIEYGAMLPRSGGIKVYLEYTFPWPRFLASTMVAVQAVILGFTASNCVVFAKYTLFASNVEPTYLNVKIIAISIMTVITLIHGVFYRTGIAIQNLLGWIKIGLALFMTITGFAVVFYKGESALRMDDVWNDSDWRLSTIAAAFFKILYSFAGLENINNVMNEVKNPIRTIKTVGPAALITACIMYVLINIAYFVVVPLNEVKQSQELIAALFFERLGFGRIFLPIAIALSAAGNVMVVTFSLARLNQEIARQGFLPYSGLFATTKPFGSPLGGLIVHYVPSVLIIALSPSASVYGLIAEIQGYAGQFFGLAIGVGIILLRKREPDIPRPFKAWLPAVWFRIFLSLPLILIPFIPSSILGTQSGRSNTYALVGGSVLCFGLLNWAVWFRLLPKYGGYRYEEKTETLSDGTTVSKLRRFPTDGSQSSN